MGLHGGVPRQDIPRRNRLQGLTLATWLDPNRTQGASPILLKTSVGLCRKGTSQVQCRGHSSQRNPEELVLSQNHNEATEICHLGMAPDNQVPIRVKENGSRISLA
jgi:hypothetical protein